MTNCKYITKNGRCGLKGSYAYRHGCFGEDMCKCREPLTNADRIRAMSDEEMAEMLYSFEDLCMPDYCQSKKECNDMLDADIVIPAENCKRCLVDWLRQPAEE